MAGGLAGTLTSAIRRMAKRATDAIDRTARSLGRKGSSDSEEADAANERDAAESAQDFDRTAREAAGDRVRKDLYRTTRLDRVWRAIVETAKRALSAANRWRRKLTRTGPAKAAMIGAGAVGGLMAVSAAIEFAVPRRDHPAPPPDFAMNGGGVPVEIDIPPPIPQNAFAPIDLPALEQEFRILRERFDRPALFASIHRERFDLDTADLPPAIEIAAAAPAAVAVIEGGSTHTETTTVGQLYAAMPEARDQIEEAVRHNPESGIRVDIDVGTEFATIRISM